MAAIPNISPGMHEQRRENRPKEKQEKQREKEKNRKKKKVETLPIGLHILHGNIKCSFRRGIMVKIAFQNDPAVMARVSKGQHAHRYTKSI
jgi:hypothetical protein